MLDSLPTRSLFLWLYQNKNRLSQITRDGCPSFTLGLKDSSRLFVIASNGFSNLANFQTAFRSSLDEFLDVEVRP